VAELALAVRRSILLTLLLAIGALAAALPALLGEPAAEHPALRGLAALVIALFAAVFLAARWGSRGPLAPRGHLLELAQVAATVTAFLLPALLAGMTTSEAEALAKLAQAAIGWKRPIAALLLGCCLLGATYLIARLKSSVKEERLAGQGLVWLSALGLMALIGVSAWRLAGSRPSESLLSRWRCFWFSCLCVVASFLRSQGARGTDLRTLSLVVGFVLIGWLICFGTDRYLRPTGWEIDRILHTSGDAQGTTFAAALDGREDIYGLFSLDYVSATPRLELVRPLGTYVEFLIEKTTQTRFGTARLEPRPELKNRWSELLPPP
jgi:cytochrome bd-type quinol oxidase subunit 2